ncbi:hypothetical protein MCERHM32_01195 [Methylophilaceae bacterium]
MKSLKYIAIIVFYYPDYFEKSSIRFKKMIANNCNNETLTVAVNNNSIDIQKIEGFDIVLDGKITSSEFYAWDFAINYLRNEGYKLDGVSFVLANDTFCQHRYFSLMHEKFFFRSVKNIGYLNTPTLVGETNALKGSFNILGLHSDRWVSTYLFSFNYIFISRINSLLLDINQFNSCVRICPDGNVFIANNISCNLKAHINNWLDDRWYKKDLLKNNSDLKRWKYFSILNEKYLSASCIEVDGIIKDPYRCNVFIYYFLKFLDRFYYFNRTKHVKKT